MISLIQHFEADFLWKDSLEILNSWIILKTFTHAYQKFLGWNWWLSIHAIIVTLPAAEVAYVEE